MSEVNKDSNAPLKKSESFEVSQRQAKKDAHVTNQMVYGTSKSTKSKQTTPVNKSSQSDE